MLFVILGYSACSVHCLKMASGLTMDGCGVKRIEIWDSLVQHIWGSFVPQLSVYKLPLLQSLSNQGYFELQISILSLVNSATWLLGINLTWSYLTSGNQNVTVPGPHVQNWSNVQNDSSSYVFLVPNKALGIAFSTYEQGLQYMIQWGSIPSHCVNSHRMCQFCNR